MKMGLQLPQCSAAIAAGVCVSLAGADFGGFTLTSQVVQGALDEYRVVRAYAQFTSATDVLLNVYDASLTLSQGATTIPGFLQASDPDLGADASFRPLLFKPATEAWTYDSFVTIGAEQGNHSNGTVLDPGFDDTGAAGGLGFGGMSGWYNLPPTNGLGVAGEDLRVLVGQFVIGSSSFVPGQRLRFAATVGVSSGGVLSYGQHEVSCVVPTSNLAKYVVDDVDGDAMSDLVLFDRATGEVSAWLMSGASLKATAPIAGDPLKGFVLQGIGDLEGDGDADVLWRNRRSGLFSVWQLQGVKPAATVAIDAVPGRGWTTLAYTDISGDAKADVLLFNRRTRQVMAWIIDGGAVASSTIIGAMPGAMPLGVGDLDGDGKRDILWRTTAGEVRGWLLDGASIRETAAISGIGGPVGRTWKVAAIADFDGDGADDLLWRQTKSGEVILWRMEGLACLQSTLLAESINATWTAEAAPDVNGDGRHDVLWRRRSDGTTMVWTADMNGAFTSTTLPSLAKSQSVAQPKMNRFE